jgi:hypothetical protein
MEIHRKYTSRILKKSKHVSRILIEERTQVNIWNKEDNWTRQALVPNMEVGKYVRIPHIWTAVLAASQASNMNGNKN